MSLEDTSMSGDYRQGKKEGSCGGRQESRRSLFLDLEETGRKLDMVISSWLGLITPVGATLESVVDSAETLTEEDSTYCYYYFYYYY